MTMCTTIWNITVLAATLAIIFLYGGSLWWLLLFGLLK